MDARSISAAVRSWLRAPYDHPDFNSNALSEDLFSASFENKGIKET
jgi:hypothetical protein